VCVSQHTKRTYATLEIKGTPSIGIYITIPKLPIDIPYVTPIIGDTVITVSLVVGTGDGVLTITNMVSGVVPTIDGVGGMVNGVVPTTIGIVSTTRGLPPSASSALPVKSSLPLAARLS
jgi:hypothetical protein